MMIAATVKMPAIQHHHELNSSLLLAFLLMINRTSPIKERMRPFLKNIVSLNKEL